MYVAALYSTLLLGTFPTVSGAQAQLEDGQLVVEVTTSEPVEHEGVHTKLDGKTLSIYLDGARVEGAKRSFAGSERVVNALPRANYAKLEVPLAPDLHCPGQPSISFEDAKVRVSLGCEVVSEAGVLKSEAKAESTAETKAETKPVTKAETKPAGWAAPPVAVTAPPAHAHQASDEAAHTAKVATKPATPSTAKPTAPLASPAAEKGTEKAPAHETAGETTSAPTASATETAKSAPARGGTAAEAPSAPSTGVSSWPFAMTLLLAGGAGYMFWRKRRQHGSNLIKILETASLGPKRALVIAEVNGEKMILGTSEAGISLLAPLAHPTGAATTAGELVSRVSALATNARSAEPQAVEAPPAAPPAEDEGEGGILARLFRQNREAAASDEEGPSTMAEDFRDLLEDSLEDEELRRRLQAGLGGRTS